MGLDSSGSIQRAAEVPIAVKRIAFDDIVKEEVIEETAGRMTRAMLEAWNTSQVYDPAMHEAIKEQFGYQYPYAGSGMQKLKFTVSELKKENLSEGKPGRGIRRKRRIIV